MTDKHFNAICAKNIITREIKGVMQNGLSKIDLNLSWILEQLKDIEEYIGEGNQPSIVSILNSEYDI